MNKQQLQKQINELKAEIMYITTKDPVIQSDFTDWLDDYYGDIVILSCTFKPSAILMTNVRAYNREYESWCQIRLAKFQEALQSLQTQMEYI